MHSMDHLQPHAGINQESLREFRTYLSTSAEAPKLPSVLQAVLECSQDPRANAEKLSVIIATDTVISAQLLKTVNSAYYGFPQQIASIKHAIVLLGFKEVTNLAIGIALMDVIKPGNSDPFYYQFKSHSLATAQLSLWLAEKIAFKDKSTIYTGGLLHDFGLLMLYAWQPEKYRQLLSICQTEKIPCFHLERKLLGLDHMTAGNLISHLWHLPTPLMISMQCHHDKNIIENPEALFIAIIQMAHVLGHQVGFPLIPQAETPKLPKTVYQLLQKVQPEFNLKMLKKCLPEIKALLAEIPALEA